MNWKKLRIPYLRKDERIDAAGAKPISEKQIDNIKVAVLIPCYNEELTIAKVVREFKAALPNAEIYVYDNNSRDATAQIAEEEGAIVKKERRQGKGFVVQSMFRQIDADVYVMVDGDDTYPAAMVRKVILPVLLEEGDMIVGSRLHDSSESKFRQLNLLGNRLFLSTLNFVFGVHLTDILSGYRVFTRNFVKSIPLVGGGFEVETELTIKALEGGFRIIEVPVSLTSRPEGSYSKIRPVQDGLRILLTIFALFRDYKPLTFFGTLAILLVGGGLIPGGIVVREYWQTGLVKHMPSAVLATGMVLLGMLMLVTGLILHSMTRRMREMEYLIRGFGSPKNFDKTEKKE